MISFSGLRRNNSVSLQMDNSTTAASANKPGGRGARKPLQHEEQLEPSVLRSGQEEVCRASTWAAEQTRVKRYALD